MGQALHIRTEAGWHPLPCKAIPSAGDKVYPVTMKSARRYIRRHIYCDWLPNHQYSDDFNKRVSERAFTMVKAQSYEH